MKTRSFKAVSLVLMVTMLLVPFASQAGASGSVAPGLAPPVQEEPLENMLPTWAQPTAPDDDDEWPIVSEPVVPKISPALRDLPTVELPLEGKPREINPLRNFFGEAGREGLDIKRPDPLMALNGTNLLDSPAPFIDWEGMGDFDLYTPPDTTGDVGPNHYFQIVNVFYSVYDKAGNQLAGPIANNALWTGFGGNCETDNDGDPIVLYDDMADRWMVSQFALGGPTLYECVAVSTSPDPLGTYYLYAFPTPDFPDYPKWGVWPDAYYMGTNTGYPNQYYAHAVDRNAMLAGDPTPLVSFGGNPNFLMPADADGLVPPPPGSPGYFYTFFDDDWANHPPGVDRLAIYEFDIDWAVPGGATFTLVTEIPIADFIYTTCGFFVGDCIPQPPAAGGQRLDAVDPWPMVRLQYRNFGSYETLVGNFTIDVDDTDHAGIRWFELRKTGANPWSLYQEGTHAPDSDHRWMGSIAMDGSGNIALGYSVSSDTTNPAIRYAVRQRTDPLGTLQAEASLIEGGGVNQGPYNRWGDYSAMNVDPVDQCTFWITNEYHDVPESSFMWNTRIGAFKVPGCTGSLGPTGVISGTVTDADTSAPIVNADVQATLVPTPTIVFNATTDASGLYEMTVATGTYTVTASAFGYTPTTVYDVKVFSGTTTIQDFGLALRPSHVVEGVVTDATTGWPLYASIAIDPAGATIWTDPVNGYYSVTLPMGITYTFDVEAWVPGYLPESRDVGPLTGDVVEDFGLTADAGTCIAPGYEQSYAYYEDFESDNGGFTISGVTSWAWGAPTSGPGAAHSGVNVWATNLSGNYNNNEDGYIESLDIDLSAFAGQNLPLEWWQWYSGENCCDYISLEVSNDGGGSWTVVYGPFDGAGVTEDVWELQSLVLDPSYAVSSFRLRFNFTSDYSVIYPGWYVDDVGVPAFCEPSPGGLVVGNVYDDNTLAPLAGAEVANEDGYAATAEETPDDPAVDDAFYTVFSPQGSKTFSGTMGSHVPDVDTVTVVQSDTVGHDFYLAAGWLSYAPDLFDVTQEMGQSTIRSLDLSNNGGAAADFVFSEIEGEFTPLNPGTLVNVPGSSRATGLPDTTAGVSGPWRYPGPRTYYDPVPLSPHAPADVLLVYADDGTDPLKTILESYPDIGLVDEWLANSSGSTPSLADLLPYDVVIVWSNYAFLDNVALGDVLADYVDAGGKVIAAAFDWASVVPSANLAGRFVDEFYDPFISDFVGNHYSTANLGAYDIGHPIMEGVTAVSDYYRDYVSLDPDAYLVASWGDGEEFIATKGSVVSINSYTGVYYQWTGDMGIVFHNAVNYLMMAGDVPWLSEDPISGTVSSLAGQVISITFDAGVPEVDQPGTYFAQLKINHDTPYELNNIPVTMTVLPPDTWGKLEGTVTGLGHCEADPAPLEEAEVFVESSGGMSWTLLTDENGYYSYWYDEASSPFTLTVAHPEHEAGTRSGVNVTGQTTTTEDFDLRWLVPCVDAAPLSLEQTLAMFDQITRTAALELLNTGAVSVTFDLVEQDGGFEPVLLFSPAAGHGEWLYRSEEGVLLSTNQGDEALVYPSAYRWEPAAPSQLNVLIYADDFIHTAPNTFVDQALQAMGIAYTAHYDGDFTGFAADLSSGGPWDLVIFQNNNYNSSGTSFPEMLAYVQGGGRLAAEVWTMLWDNADPLYAEMGVSYVDNDLAVPPVYWWDPGHNIFNTPESAPEWLIRSCPAAYSCGQYLDPVVGVSGALAGYTTPGPDAGQATLILRDDGQTVYKGFADVTTDADADVDGTVDGVELWTNIATGLLYGFGADVPWLSEDPITGTLAADTGSQFVDVGFDAGVPEVDQPGDYYATLNFKSDDPVNDTIGVAVTMTVLPPATWGKLEGTVTDLGHCDENPVPVEGQEVLVETWMTETITVTYPIIEMYEDFETTDGGYVHGGTMDEWEWGTPIVWPYGCASGSNCWGTDLDDTYEDNANNGLASVVYDLSGASAPLDAVWWQALDIESSSYDHAYAEVRINGGPWTQMWSHTGGTVTQDWTEMSYDISAAAGGTVRFRWRMTTDGSVTYNGYYIDDVSVVGTGSSQVEVPISWVLETDENGYYTYWYDESYSPLTVTVDYPEHEFGLASSVVISGGTVTPVDFDLRWLAPCVSADPGSMDVAVLRGTSLTETLTLANTGAVSTPFEMQEQVGTEWPPEAISIPASDGGLTRGSEPASLLQYAESNVTREGPIVNAPETPMQTILLDQAPNQSDGIFADAGCDICGGAQVLAENFALSTQETIGQIVFWTGYYPGDVPIAPDTITVIFHTDAGGLPGTAISTEANVPYDRVQTGVILFGVHEWMHTLTLASPVTLGPGTYWVEIYNDTGFGTDDFFWEVGDPDTVGNGLPGSGYAFEAPGSSWNYDGATELALQLITASPDVPWLDEDPITGTLAADTGAQPLDIIFTAFPTMTAGPYTATLVAKSDDPVFGSMEIPVTMTVVYAPICDFDTSSPDDLGDATVFTNTTDEGYAPTSYRWNFDDGSAVSAAINPTHTYDLPGLYTAALTATNAYGENVCTATVSIEGVVGGFASNSPVQLGDLMVFTNTTVANPEVTGSFWTFGDGGSSEDEHPTHVYDEAGTYTVTLFVANDTYAPSNVWDIYQDTVEVLPAACVPVSGADFTHVENPPLVVRFSGTVTPGTASLPITYAWDFGDGNVGSGQVVTHTYELSSTTSYTVTMTASNPCPIQSTVQKLITLWPRTIYLPAVLRNY